jgi:hypothetical protein
MKNTNEVVRILMERDGMTREEAIERIDEVREMIFDDPGVAEDILADELGLELDYIHDIIW